MMTPKLGMFSIHVSLTITMFNYLLDPIWRHTKWPTISQKKSRDTSTAKSFWEKLNAKSYGVFVLTRRRTQIKKVHGANMGPIWVLSAPDGPHVDPMNLAIRRFQRAEHLHRHSTKQRIPHCASRWRIQKLNTDIKIFDNEHSYKTHFSPMMQLNDYTVADMMKLAPCPSSVLISNV